MSKILLSNSLRGGVILSTVAQGWLIPAPPECRGPAARVCRGRQPLTGPARETVEEQPECRKEVPDIVVVVEVEQSTILTEIKQKILHQ